MGVADFEDFCSSLCELIGAPAPALVPDPNGLVGFTVDFEETSIGFLKGQRGNEPGVLMMVGFGIPPKDKEAAVWRSLVDANFLMAGIGSPAFARNTVTGEVSLQQSFTLSQVDLQDIYQGIANAAYAVTTWKKSDFSELSLSPKEE
jgi:hypothetical protein